MGQTARSAADGHVGHPLEVQPGLAAEVVRFFRDRDYPVLCLHDADQAGFDYLVWDLSNRIERYQ